MKLPEVSMDIHIQYLLGFIEDELRDLEGLRIHPLAPTGTQKSIDLPQDYDPSEGHLHRARGVRVRAGSREYFFSAEWASKQEFSKIKAQTDEIRTFCLQNKIEKL